MASSIHARACSSVPFGSGLERGVPCCLEHGLSFACCADWVDEADALGGGQWAAAGTYPERWLPGLRRVCKLCVW